MDTFECSMNGIGSFSGYRFCEVETCNMCGVPKTLFHYMGRRLNQRQGAWPFRKSGISVSILRCKSCGLIFSNPRPEPARFEDHYGVSPESYWTPEQLHVDPRTREEIVYWLKFFTKGVAKPKVLDVGTGTGKWMKVFEAEGSDVYGLEPSPTFAEFAIRSNHISPDKLQQCPVEEAKYEDNFFDYISYGAVLEHLYQPSECIERSMKWLKPGGILRIEVPNARWLTAGIYNLYYRMIFTEFVTNLSPMHAPYHLYEFTPKSFELNGVKTGYSTVKVQFENAQSFLPGFLNWIIYPIMRWTNSGMQLIVYLQKNR